MLLKLISSLAFYLFKAVTRKSEIIMWLKGQWEDSARRPLVAREPGCTWAIPVAISTE